MIDALRSEWIKLRTIRMNWILLAIAVAFPPIVCLLTTAFQKTENISAQDIVSLVWGTSIVTALLLGVIAATAITGEFGFGTIRPTFAATPRRHVIVIAKAVVMSVVALLAEAIVVGFTYAASSTIASARDVSVSLSDVPAGAAPLLGVTVFAGLVALVGHGLGLIVRNTPATVSILLGWALVVEGLIAGLLTALGVDHAAKYVPFSAGVQMGNPDAGSDPEVLSRLAGGLYFGAVAVVLVVIGGWLTSRRDA